MLGVLRGLLGRGSLLAGLAFVLVVKVAGLLGDERGNTRGWIDHAGGEWRDEFRSVLDGDSLYWAGDALDRFRFLLRRCITERPQVWMIGLWFNYWRAMR